MAINKTESYTSHGFRRSAATWLVDAGVSLPNLKRFGRWKSDSVASGYVNESASNKLALSQTLQTGQMPSSSPPLSQELSLFRVQTPTSTRQSLEISQKIGAIPQSGLTASIFGEYTQLSNCSIVINITAPSPPPQQESRNSDDPNRI